MCVLCAQEAGSPDMSGREDSASSGDHWSFSWACMLFSFSISEDWMDWSFRHSARLRVYICVPTLDYQRKRKKVYSALRIPVTGDVLDVLRRWVFPSYRRLFGLERVTLQDLMFVVVVDVGATNQIWAPFFFSFLRGLISFFHWISQLMEREREMEVKMPSSARAACNTLGAREQTPPPLSCERSRSSSDLWS